MGKHTYYAITSGRTTGLFTDWESCYESTNNFPDSSYRAFFSLKNARSYLDSKDVIYTGVNVFLSQLKDKAFSKNADWNSFSLNDGKLIDDIDYITEVLTQDFQGPSTHYLPKEVYTSGRSLKGQSSTIEVYFGSKDSRNESLMKSVGVETAKLCALYDALEMIIKSLISESFATQYVIYSDSKYILDNWLNIGLKTLSETEENKDLLHDVFLLYTTVNSIYKHLGWAQFQIVFNGVSAVKAKTHDFKTTKEFSEKKENSIIQRPYSSYASSLIYFIFKLFMYIATIYFIITIYTVLTDDEGENVAPDPNFTMEFVNGNVVIFVPSEINISRVESQRFKCYSY